MPRRAYTAAPAARSLVVSAALTWSAAAVALDFESGLEHSFWSARGDNQECVLEHVVRGYGDGRFTHTAGADRRFALVADDPRFDVGTLIVSAEPPPWRPHLAGARLAELKYGGESIGADDVLTSRMLTTLSRGLDVEVAGMLQFSTRARLRVAAIGSALRIGISRFRRVRKRPAAGQLRADRTAADHLRIGRLSCPRDRHRGARDGGGLRAG